MQNIREESAVGTALVWTATKVLQLLKSPARASLLLWCAAVILGLGGCTVSRGTYVDPNALAHIKKGKTTKQEVVSLIGYPLRQSSDHTGTTTFTYMHERGGTAAMQEDRPRGVTLLGTTSKETQITIIRFTPTGVVDMVTYSSTTDVDHPLIGPGAMAPSQSFISPYEQRGLVQP